MILLERTTLTYRMTHVVKVVANWWFAGCGAALLGGGGGGGGRGSPVVANGDIP